MVADDGILEFNKVTDLDSLADNRTGTYTNERTHVCTVLYLRTVALNIVERNVVTDNAVLNETVRAYIAVCTDNGLALDYRAGENLRICFDFSVG